MKDNTTNDPVSQEFTMLSAGAASDGLIAGFIAFASTQGYQVSDVGVGNAVRLLVRSFAIAFTPKDGEEKGIEFIFNKKLVDHIRAAMDQIFPVSYGIFESSDHSEVKEFTRKFIRTVVYKETLIVLDENRDQVKAAIDELRLLPLPEEYSGG